MRVERAGTMTTRTSHATFREHLTRLVEQGAERAREKKQDILVSVTDECDPIDPIRLFANSTEISTDRWYWEHPDGGLAISSAGVITGSTFPRKIRFTETERNRRQLMEHAIISPEPGDGSPGPILFAGFSFDPYRMQDRQVWQGFQSSFLLVPRVVLIRTGSQYFLTFNALVGPNRAPDDVACSTAEFREVVLDSIVKDLEGEDGVQIVLDDPDTSRGTEEPQFLHMTGTAVDTVQAGDVEWLSTARRMRLTTSHTFNVVQAIDQLRTGYPEFRTVAAARHGSTYVGLARDTLASVRGSSLISSCSFGSIRRGEHQDLDEALARHLQEDEITLERHGASVQAIMDALNQVSETVSRPRGSELRTLDEAHFLHTRVEASLRADASLLDAIKALHPSPMMTGNPAQTSLVTLREREEIDRGWFCSPFGWIGSGGDGDFIAADRAAVIREPVLDQQRAYLFAATPVHGDTDPEKQLADSETALAPLLAALTE